MRNRLRLNKPSEKGLTLIELAVSIALTVVIIYVAIQVAPKLLGQYKSSSEIRSIPLLATNISTTYSDVNEYPTSGDQVISDGVKKSIFPDESVKRLNGTLVLSNRWGGRITFRRFESSLAMEYSDVPNQECFDMISSLSGMFENIAVRTQSRKGLVARTYSNGPGEGDSVLSPNGRVNLASMSDGGPSGRCTGTKNLNTVTFYIRK